MASAGFQTLPISELAGMKLYNSEGDVLGEVKQVIRNEKGRDSIIVTRTSPAGKNLPVPLEYVVVRAKRLFTHGLGDSQLDAMPGVAPSAGTQMDDRKTVEIGAEN